MLGHVTSTKWRSVQSRDSLINVKGSCRICEEFWSWHSAEQDLAKRFPSWVPGSRDLGATATRWLCSKLQLQDKWTASLPPSSPPFSLPPALPSSVLSCVCDEYIGQQVCVWGGGSGHFKKNPKGFGSHFPPLWSLPLYSTSGWLGRKLLANSPVSAHHRTTEAADTHTTTPGL